MSAFILSRLTFIQTLKEKILEQKTHKLKLITASIAATMLTIGMIVLLEVQRTGTSSLV